MVSKINYIINSKLFNKKILKSEIKYDKIHFSLVITHYITTLNKYKIITVNKITEKINKKIDDLQQKITQRKIIEISKIFNLFGVVIINKDNLKEIKLEWQGVSNLKQSFKEILKISNIRIKKKIEQARLPLIDIYDVIKEIHSLTKPENSFEDNSELDINNINNKNDFEIVIARPCFNF